MTESLQKKIREVEDEHAAELEQSHIATHDQLRRDQAMQMLGAAKYADSLRARTASHVIQFLMTVEEEKIYRDYGFDRFVDFLQASELSDISKSQYYRLRELYLKEGPEQYDWFTAWKIPLATRQLLDTGDIVVEGDEVVIGGEERVPLGEQKVIKSIIEKLVTEKRNATDDLAKSESKIENLNSKIAQGQRDYDELERNLEALKKRDPLTAQFNTVVYEICEFHRVVGQQTDGLKASVGTAWLQVLASLYFRTADAFGVKAALADRDAVLTGDTLDAKIAEVIAEAGPMNFADEDEG